MPQPQLGRVVAEANDLQDDLRFEVTSLADYLSGRTTEGLTVVHGELRSGFRANMLMGVTSNRVDVKRRGALAERELERRAEPLAALFQPPAAYPSRLLELAWREMVRNSAHDSICACSVDDVVDAVLHRYAEARAIAAGLADRSVKAFALSLAEPGISVLNPSPRARSGVVELVVPADGLLPRQVQVISERSGLPGRWCSTPTRCARCWPCCRGPRSTTTPGSTRSGSRTPTRASTSRSRSARRRSRTSPSWRPSRTSTPGSGRSRRHGARRHGAAVDQEDRRPHGRGGGVRVERLRAGGTGAPGRGDRIRRIDLPGQRLVRVEIDPPSGTFSLDGVAGYGRLVDDGDLGDSYNYSPPQRDSVVETPESVTVR